ncbi:DUF3108 domain-containing protein [Methylibium sp.]|uniref:DUF3108 domain-containing protein n=1 Tax=Methylibium sp. TaxID=2067992 RepID=UPI00179312DE|nr:DUF3108 domain-containing protein [Methylibium sp.]MBA3589857.1 DUF3108 domain-containing protein [Methylibium sp.]
MMLALLCATAIRAAPPAPLEPALTTGHPAPRLAQTPLAGERPAAKPSAEASTAYRTRVPASARITYRLSRSGIVGTGLLDWRVEGDTYVLRLEGSVPIIGTLIVQTSRGGFDAAGLAPTRYTDKRWRRDESVADFDRDAGRIVFSNDKPALPLHKGTQDRLSVMVQLAAIANAWSEPPTVGTVLTLSVVGARGDAKLWALRYEGPQALRTGEVSVRALRFLRQPEEPGDTRAEFWLDPAASHLPVRARLTDGDGDALELLRTQAGP